MNKLKSQEKISRKMTKPQEKNSKLKEKLKILAYSYPDKRKRWPKHKPGVNVSRNYSGKHEAIKNSHSHEQT